MKERTTERQRPDALTVTLGQDTIRHVAALRELARRLSLPTISALIRGVAESFLNDPDTTTRILSSIIRVGGTDGAKTGGKIRNSSRKISVR